MPEIFTITTSKNLGPPGPAMVACMDRILSEGAMSLAQLREVRERMRESGHTEEEGVTADAFMEKAEAYYAGNGMDGETVVAIDHYPLNERGTEIMVITDSANMGNPGEPLYTALNCEGSGNTVCLSEARAAHAELEGDGEYDEEDRRMAAAFIEKLDAYYKVIGYDAGDPVAVSIY